MGPLSTYFQLTKDQQQAIQSVLPDTNQQQPQIDTNDPINSLADILVTPAEREAREQKMLENKRRMIAWTGLFDGLRQLGNLYYATKGATPQQFTDKPYQQIEANYQAEMKRQADLDKYRDDYTRQLWSLKRQGAEDARKKALLDIQQKNYESVIKERNEKLRQQEELNQAKNKYWQAMAQKNTEQAEYWRLRAQGVPEESAAKIAKDYAQAEKARNSGGSGTGRNNGTYGYKTVRHIDPATGDVITERIPTTGEKPNIKVQQANKGKNNKKGGSAKSKVSIK